MAGQGSYVPFNFPNKPAICKKRQLFANYGPSLLTADRDGDIIFQRLKRDDFKVYCPVNPILPLSSAAEQVSLPTKDRIMGDILERNNKMKEFSVKILKFHQQGKKWGKMDHVEYIKETIGNIRQLLSENFDLEPHAEAEFMEVKSGMYPFLKEFIQDYKTLKDNTALLLTNYRYAGGCLTSMQTDDNYFFTASASGEDFDTLQLRFVSEKTDMVLQSCAMQQIKMPQPIYSIKSRKVQGQDYLCVRMADHCHTFSFHKDAKKNKLRSLHQLKHNGLQCIDMSPYIPDESVIVNKKGKVLLWNGETELMMVDNLEPRFSVSDPWRHIQYGSHPRQIIYADQTVVQLYDTRTPNYEALDLLSIPSKLLQSKERVHMCGKHPTSEFYHIIATNENLLILDERFPQSPVLKYEHLLSAPPQYMSCLEKGVGKSDCNFIYLASQYPADVHVFRFAVDKGCPPTSVALPYKASSLKEFCNTPEFVDKCPNTDILLEQLKCSIAGITTFTMDDRHVLLQLDSHGNIFHQVFSPKDNKPDEIFSTDVQPSNEIHSVALERAQTWVQSWVDIVKQKLKVQRISGRPMVHDLLGIFHYKEPHKMCCVCRPELQHMPQVTSASSTEFCQVCMVYIKDGFNLTQCAEKDSILACKDKITLNQLKEPKDLPVKTALSKLLNKHWYEDSEMDMDDILREWDKEVIEKMKKSKTPSKTDYLDMSEESVLRRIQSETAGSSTSQSPNREPDVQNTQAGSRPDESGSKVWEPSLASSTEQSDIGSPDGSARKKVRHKMSKEGRKSNSVVTEKEGSVHSFALGSVASFDSGIFPSQTFKASPVKTGQTIEKRGTIRKRHSSKVLTPEKDTDQSIVLGTVSSFESETFPNIAGQKTRRSTRLTPPVSVPAQVGRSDKHICNASESLFSSDNSEVDSPDKTQLSAISKSSYKRNKHKRPKEIEDDSESENSETMEIAGDDDAVSSVLSVVNCPGLNVSQVAKTGLSSPKKISDQSHDSSKDTCTFKVPLSQSNKRSSVKKNFVVESTSLENSLKKKSFNEKSSENSGKKAVKRKLIQDGF